MFCWGLPSTFVDFFSISKQMTLSCFYLNTLLSLHITVSWNFSHFSDKAEFPWLFPSCLFETLLKPFVLALHFLLADDPSLSSDGRHTPVCSGRRRASELPPSSGAMRHPADESRQSSAGDLHLAWWHSDVLTPSCEFSGGARLRFFWLITHWAVRLAPLDRMSRHHSEYTSDERIFLYMWPE